MKIEACRGGKSDERVSIRSDLLAIAVRSANTVGQYPSLMPWMVQRVDIGPPLSFCSRLLMALRQ